MLLPHSLNTALSEQRLLKVIAGLANFDATAVAMVAVVRGLREALVATVAGTIIAK